MIGMLSELKNEVWRKAGVRVPREISCKEVGSPSLPFFEGESLVAQKWELIGTESLNKFYKSCSFRPSHILLSKRFHSLLFPLLIYLRNDFMSRAYIDMKIDVRVKKEVEES